MNILICPVCKNALSDTHQAYQCALKHSFDKSRNGYVNLLLPNKKSSKDPGDNKEMVKSRSAFLGAGYYARISELLNGEVHKKLTQLANPDLQVLDIGCGTGYYLQNLKNYLTTELPENKRCHYWGIDIAKEAIHVAAKDKDIKWLVSNISELPFQDKSLQCMVSVFSPHNFPEFSRILSDDGYLFIIFPLAQHLYELRQILFADIKQIEEDRILKKCSDTFAVEEKIPLQYQIDLPANQDIANLFSMTPYYWRCTPDKRQEILALQELKLTIDVGLWILKKPQ